MSEIVAISGVGPVLAKACIGKGFGSVEKIASASVPELVVVQGVSDTRAKQLIRTAQLLLNGGTAPEVATVDEMDAAEKMQAKKGSGKKKKKNNKNKKKDKSDKSKNKKKNKKKDKKKKSGKKNKKK